MIPQLLAHVFVELISFPIVCTEFNKNKNNNDWMANEKENFWFDLLTKAVFPHPLVPINDIVCKKIKKCIKFIDRKQIE